MPSVKPGESQKDYVNRCVPFVIKEHKGKVKPDQAVAMCNGMYRDHNKGISVSIEGFESAAVYMEHISTQLEGVEKKSLVTQTLIMSKERFPTRTAAKSWAKEKGFSADTIRETTDSWRIRQRTPEDFAQESFRTINMTSGVVAVAGHLKG